MASLPMELNETADLERDLDPEHVYASTCARYQEIVTKCKFLQARLLLARANVQESTMPWEDSLVDEVDVAKSLTTLEQSTSRICNQEKAVLKAKTCDLAVQLLTSENPPTIITDLIAEHTINQTNLVEIATQLRQERLKVLEAQGKLYEKLEAYVASIEKDQANLKNRVPESSKERMNNLQHKVRAIAFMQNTIGQLLAYSDVDLRKNKTLQAIAKSNRNRILSIDHFL